MAGWEEGNSSLSREGKVVVAGVYLEGESQSMENFGREAVCHAPHGREEETLSITREDTIRYARDSCTLQDATTISDPSIKKFPRRALMHFTSVE